MFKNKALSYLVFHDVVSSVKKEIGVHIFWRAGQACQLSPRDPRPRRAIWKASEPFVANFPSWDTQRKMLVCWEGSWSGCHHFTRSWQDSVYSREAENGWFGLGWRLCLVFMKGLSCAPVPCARSRDMNFKTDSCCKHSVELSLVNPWLILSNIWLTQPSEKDNKIWILCGSREQTSFCCQCRAVIQISANAPGFI